MLKMFDTKAVEYYRCKYYGDIKDDSFEERAIAYIENVLHSIEAIDAILRYGNYENI